MKTKISALLDGELDSGEVRAVCTALRHDGELRRAAGVYALIGDALRREIHLATDLTGRVLDRLADEPVILAPQGWHGAEAGSRSWNRPMLALAASMVGVAVVAWLGMTTRPQQLELIAMLTPAPAVQHPFVAAVNGGDPDMQEYLIAHQIHSGATYLSGEAQNIRTVSSNRVDSN